MEPVSIGATILVGMNLLITYKGLTEQGYMEEYCFDVDAILIGRDYKRLVTSGFLHVSWRHFLFNMITLYCFSVSLEKLTGIQSFLIIYFASLIGGDLLSLFIHRHHGDYTSVGASGAVSGIVFAAIAVFPGMNIGFFGLPLYIPGWLYGILYVLYSVYGIKSQKDNIGHDAHLGGGLIGLLAAVCIYPNSLRENYLPILMITVPALFFIYFIITRPEFLLVDNLFQKGKGFKTVEDKYNLVKRRQEMELNEILDKIGRNGIESLTKEEKLRLEEISNNN